MRQCTLGLLIPSKNTIVVSDRYKEEEQSIHNMNAHEVRLGRSLLVLWVVIASQASLWLTCTRSLAPNHEQPNPGQTNERTNKRTLMWTQTSNLDIVRDGVKKEIAKRVIRAKLSKTRHLVLDRAIRPEYLDSLFPMLLDLFQPQTVTVSVKRPRSSICRHTYIHTYMHACMPVVGE